MDSETELTSMNVSLPRDLKDYIRDQASRTGCSTPSEYIRRLIHEDQRTRAREELERKFLEGLVGDDVEMTREDWNDIRAAAVQSLRERRKNK